MLSIERTLRALVAARWRLVGLTMVLVVGTCARGMSESIAPADVSIEARRAAAAAIPFDQLTAAAQARLLPVVNSPSIYRRLPSEVITCERDMYLTLVCNPEIIVGIWHLMEVTELDMRRTGPFTLDCDDKVGTTSQVELIYGTANTHIFYADTLYEGSLFARPVKGRVVLLLRSEYLTDEQGRPQVKSTMDAFIRIDHVTAKLVARTLAPMVGRTADHNFGESFRFLSRVNEAAEENGPGMRELSARLDNVDADTQRKFAEVATIVNQRAATRRELASMATPASPIAVDPSPMEATTVQPTPPASEGLESALGPPQRATQWRR